jgi:hypothetical protein
MFPYMEEVEVGGERGMVMLLRLWRRHQPRLWLLLRWRHQPWLRLRLRWRHQRRLRLVVVLKSVEVVVGLRGRHQPAVRVAVLLRLLRVVVIHLPLAPPAAAAAARRPQVGTRCGQEKKGRTWGSELLNFQL